MKISKAGSQTYVDKLKEVGKFTNEAEENNNNQNLGINPMGSVVHNPVFCYLRNH